MTLKKTRTTNYIVQLAGFEGDNTTLTIETHEDHSDPDNNDWEPADYLYCIVQVDWQGASIVDNGYRSIDEAAQAWPDAVKPSAKHLAHAGRAFAERVK